MKMREDRIVVLMVDDKLLPAFMVKEEKNDLGIYSAGKIPIESVRTIYRNLRENYEYRMRYDEAGMFFIREMELKRKYRDVSSISTLKKIHEHLKLKNSKSRQQPTHELQQNGWFRRHFSVTGLYFHLARYGEDLFRPSLSGVVIVLLSTLLWITQSNPLLEPTFFGSMDAKDTSTFIGFEQMGNITQWQLSFDRSLKDFIPIFPLGDQKIVLFDYIIKFVGGILSLGLLTIALRRKFERRFRH
jgi:hypothetical protein